MSRVCRICWVDSGDSHAFVTFVGWIVANVKRLSLLVFGMWQLPHICHFMCSLFSELRFIIVILC